jgi:hypothetical protein
MTEEQLIERDGTVIEAVARRVVELLREEGIVERQQDLWSARRVAEHLGVTPDYVYEHASELGAIRIGTGPAARLRFDPTIVRSRLAAQNGSRRRPASQARRSEPEPKRSGLLPIG